MGLTRGCRSVLGVSVGSQGECARAAGAVAMRLYRGGGCMQGRASWRLRRGFTMTSATRSSSLWTAGHSSQRGTCIAARPSASSCHRCSDAHAFPQPACMTPWQLHASCLMHCAAMLQCSRNRMCCEHVDRSTSDHTQTRATASTNADVTLGVAIVIISLGAVIQC